MHFFDQEKEKRLQPNDCPKDYPVCVYGWRHCFKSIEEAKRMRWKFHVIPYPEGFEIKKGWARVPEQVFQKSRGRKIPEEILVKKKRKIGALKKPWVSFGIYGFWGLAHDGKKAFFQMSVKFGIDFLIWQIDNFYFGLTEGLELWMPFSDFSGSIIYSGEDVWHEPWLLMISHGPVLRYQFTKLLSFETRILLTFGSSFFHKGEMVLFLEGELGIYFGLPNLGVRAFLLNSVFFGAGQKVCHRISAAFSAHIGF